MGDWIQRSQDAIREAKQSHITYREFICTHDGLRTDDSVCTASPISTGNATEMGIRRIVLPACAKINLHLGIYPHREGETGYHKADTVMAPLGLCDWVCVEIEPSADTPTLASQKLPVITLEMSESYGVSPSENTAYRAAQLVCEAFSMRAMHIRIYIEKHIPAQSGLGGSSSDAACVLRALCHLLKLSCNDERILSIGRSIGADVAFFLSLSPKFMCGVGDLTKEVFAPFHLPCVLVRPSVGVSTVSAYALFDRYPTQPLRAEAMCKLLRVHSSTPMGVEKISSLLYNNLAEAVMKEVSEVKEVCTWLNSDSRVVRALVTGSGSAVFALCKDDTTAQDIARCARLRDCWAYSTFTVGLQDEV